MHRQAAHATVWPSIPCDHLQVRAIRGTTSGWLPAAPGAPPVTRNRESGDKRMVFRRLPVFTNASSRPLNLEGLRQPGA